MKRMAIAAAIAAAALTGSQASASVRITEWMYNGSEYIELTNLGGLPVDFTGWTFDDQDPPTMTQAITDLTPFGIVVPGESVVIAEAAEAAFRALWSLPLSVKVLGGNTNNFGRNDVINLYDPSSTLVDTLLYGDDAVSGYAPGSIRTNGTSGNPSSPADLGISDDNKVYGWVLSVVGDRYGSYASTGGHIGNPGTNAVPEPTTLALAGLGLAAMGVLHRRRG